ncbi:cysteine dioxygenase [Biomphalaria glabrata]|nr:Biomphalaria glabrata cysteine dioxygenase-like [Biomphalaria glabrata]
MDMEAHLGEGNSDEGDIMSLALLTHLLRLVTWTDQNEAEIKCRRLLERYKGDVHDWGSIFKKVMTSMIGNFCCRSRSSHFCCWFFHPEKATKYMTMAVQVAFLKCCKENSLNVNTTNLEGDKND